MYTIYFKWNKVGGVLDNISHRSWSVTRRELFALLRDPAYTLVKVVKH